ncbi:hypothetical protein ACXYX3_17575 [Mycobacterium sp. C3-094]
MAWKVAAEIGDTDPLISDARDVLGRQEYGKAAQAEGGDTYTEVFRTAMLTYAERVNDQVRKGTRPFPLVNTSGAFDWSVKKQMQIGQYAPPPRPKRRFPAFVFRGTGGIIGQDLVSLVCQANTDLVEEINTPWAATMGGLPVGTAGSVNDPSMWRAVQEALPLAQQRFTAIRTAWPDTKIVIGKYSAGDVVGSLFEQWVRAEHPDNYLCSFSFGPPTRPGGGGFYGQIPKWGNGIADMELGDTTDYRGIWLCNDGDMYGQIPGGQVGELMELIFIEVTKFELSNPLEFARRMVEAVPTVMKAAGIPLTGVLGALAGGIPGVLAFGVPALIGAITGLIAKDVHIPPEKLTGTAAAGWAARYALEFMAAGTGPHIRYHIDPAWPGGPTFLDLARMHVRDWCTRPENYQLLL